MELILGTAGQPHVTSQQMREIFKMVVGSGSYILNSGEYLEPELQSNQALRIRSGILMHHGGIAEVKQNTYDEVTIGNGTQGMKRIDLVVARYTKDPETEHETMTWVVIQGTPAASDPVAPAYTEGDMQNGDLTDDCPVFEVHLDGIQVTDVVKLVEILDCDLSSLNGKMKWKLLQSVTGSGVITLPDNYDELLAIAIADSTDNYSKYSVQIPHELLSAQQEWHRFKAGSYSSTAYNSEAVVRVKEDSMQLASFYINGANRVDTCGMRVYYR